MSGIQDIPQKGLITTLMSDHSMPHLLGNLKTPKYCHVISPHRPCSAHKFVRAQWCGPLPWVRPILLISSLVMSCLQWFQGSPSTKGSHFPLCLANAVSQKQRIDEPSQRYQLRDWEFFCKNTGQVNWKWQSLTILEIFCGVGCPLSIQLFLEGGDSPPG